MISFDGKVILITGGTRGIGAACSRMFAEGGASVATSYLSDHDSAQKLAVELAAKDADCLAVAGDLSREEDAANLVNETVERFGRIDVLVNNHGIWNEGALLIESGAPFGSNTPNNCVDSGAGTGCLDGLVFLDGFESGDTSAWSSAVP